MGSMHASKHYVSVIAVQEGHLLASAMHDAQPCAKCMMAQQQPHP